LSQAAGRPSSDYQLTRVGAHFDHAGEVETRLVCVHGRRQWSRWRNVWHSAAIRSTLFTLGAPFRAVRR
jgi:hypothetical protein